MSLGDLKEKIDGLKSNPALSESSLELVVKLSGLATMCDKASEFWREEAFKATWTLEKVKSYIPGNVLEKVCIDADVAKDINPNFSFEQAIRDMTK